jgi:hypothetical protein
MKKLMAVLVPLAIAIVGVHVLTSSHASTASLYGSIQAALGAVTVPATVQNDSTAIGGRVMVFGAPPAPVALAVHVSGNQLINGQSQAIRLLGTNSSTTEFCTTTNTIAGDAPLSKAEADGIAAWKMNAVRVPLNEDCWLGINGVSFNGASASASAQA